MSTLNRYISKRVLLGITGAFAIITSVIMLIDFVESSRSFDASSSASMIDIMFLTVLNAPQLVEKTIPFIVLFGVMTTLFSLNKHSEFIVLRAAGLSAWSFLRPAVLVTGIIGILWAIAFNPMAVFTAQKHDNLKQKLSRASSQILLQNKASNKNIWLREGNEDGHVNIHAKAIDLESRTLLDVTFFYSDFLPNGRTVFTTRYDAKSAELFSENYWVLSDVTEHEDGRPSRHFDTVSKPTAINLEMLGSHNRSQKNTPFWQIRSQISKAKQAGYDTTPLVIKLHKLLSLPITLIAMTIIAACAALHNTRSGGTLYLLIAGAVLGFGEYFIDNMISAFGEAGTLPPVLSAWAVPLLVLFCGLAMLSKIEDG